MNTQIECKCQLPTCGKSRFLPPSLAKNRKYCSASCSHIHQKQLGIRKNNKNNSLETLVRLYGKEEGTSRHAQFRKKISEYVKVNPVLNNKGKTLSEETKRKISASRKEKNRKKKLSLEESKISQDSIRKLNYDQSYGEGAHDKLRERMKGVFTLPWFIKKYGAENGTRLYYERCANIKKTTHFKVYNKTNKNNISKISQQLFDILYQDDSLNLKQHKVYYQALNHEHGCYTSRNFDFVVLDKLKIIEFNGDLFHANPTIYSPDDTPNPFAPTLKASQMWTDDKEKNQAAIDKGFEILIIWESEYKNNKERAINKCKQFLKT